VVGIVENSVCGADNSLLVAWSAPVFRLRSKRGKLLLETSSR